MKNITANNLQTNHYVLKLIHLLKYYAVYSESMKGII
jgi:hypothetical protein